MPLSSAKPACSSYHKDHTYNEVEDLHHIMEHRHFCLEEEHCSDDDEARDPRTDEWTRVSARKELLTDAFAGTFESGFLHGGKATLWTRPSTQAPGVVIQ